MITVLMFIIIITTTLPQRQLGFMGHEFQRQIKVYAGKFRWLKIFFD